MRVISKSSGGCKSASEWGEHTRVRDGRTFAIAPLAPLPVDYVLPESFQL